MHIYQISVLCINVTYTKDWRKIQTADHIQYSSIKISRYFQVSSQSIIQFSVRLTAIPQTYLEPSETSKMELFSENSQRLKTVNYFNSLSCLPPYLSNEKFDKNTTIFSHMTEQDLTISSLACPKVPQNSWKFWQLFINWLLKNKNTYSTRIRIGT